jgi:hypothetical protein
MPTRSLIPLVVPKVADARPNGSFRNAGTFLLSSDLTVATMMAAKIILAPERRDRAGTSNMFDGTG